MKHVRTLAQGKITKTIAGRVVNAADIFSTNFFGLLTVVRKTVLATHDCLNYEALFTGR